MADKPRVDRKQFYHQGSQKEGKQCTQNSRAVVVCTHIHINTAREDGVKRGGVVTIEEGSRRNTFSHCVNPVFQRQGDACELGILF